MEIRELEPRHKQTWEQFVSQHPLATIFHSTEWSSILSETYNVKPIPHIFLQHGEVVGLCPFFLTERGGIRILASPLRGWATPYGGPLLDAGLKPRDLAELLEQLRRKLGIHYCEMTFPISSDLTNLTQWGYSFEDRSTLVLKLSSNPDLVWKRMEGRCRNHIRKALKTGVEVGNCEDPSFLETYWNMAIATYQKSRRPPAIPLRLLQLVFERLRPRGQAEFFVAKRQNKPLAAAIILRHRDTFYYWDGVGFPESYCYCPNNLVQWIAIQKACQEGGRLYDLLGANNPSIARFKRSFGSTPHHYNYLYKSWGWRAALGREIYRRLVPALRAFRWRKGTKVRKRAES